MSKLVHEGHEVTRRPVAKGTLLFTVLSPLPQGCLLGLCLAIAQVAAAQDWRFTTDRAGEVGLTIRAEAPGSNWGRPGAEAVVLTLAVDGRYNQDVTLFLGETPHDYRVLLGPLAAGTHRLRYERNRRYSAAGAHEFRASFRAEVLDDPALAHAPFLYLRPDTAGRFSDLPLLAWYEWLDEPSGRVLQFSIIFTNEDGGTNTEALMARWGRTLDIEYVYRWNPAGAATYQARDHKELPFRGRKLGRHALLYDATLNNVFSDSGRSPLRVALWPVPADLSRHSREELADENPWTYRVMAEELAREGKTAQIGDPRDYLYVEADVTAAHAAASFAANGVASDRGRPDLRIERDGWVRAAIPMPRREAGELEFRCHAPRKPQQDPQCSIRSVSKIFFLDENYRPGPNLLRWEGPPARLAPGSSTRIPPPAM